LTQHGGLDSQAARCHARIMSEQPGRYAKTMDELERSAHVPVEDQTEEQPEADAPSAALTWDEARREARVAGGA
jgi:hypothetical protein